MNHTPLIVGAGLAGLLAAHAWPTARIIESSSGPRETHKALLRFRTDSAAKLTGTEFRKVRVRKAIYSDGAFRSPDVKLCNWYALKTIGALRDRSIWNVDPVDRYVAPEDWYDQILDAVKGRIEWATPYAPQAASPVVSTAPMPVMLKFHDTTPWGGCATFHRSPIRVTRFRIPRADVFQTLYFPDLDTSVYRASITGSLLIVEEVIVKESLSECIAPEALMMVVQAFGLVFPGLAQLEATDQSYGKVDELDAKVRKCILFTLASRHNIYSLGRFATWRNILLDDVVEDIAVIKRLINQASNYELNKYANT